ncbi:hypothetical protein [Natranaerofaba carboxydovora]|uniref:hypothetical protein n=1 Tax=Natranaerofaba carboxydovora TaxID=2742683 RepID=UPI001F143EC1|nr:hypothetical protein [Natranaerofaba carboxydovora]UMZ74095.1 hypothetical protein ACONDI_01674 [Natranaerofaba carboxydovora]
MELLGYLTLLVFLICVLGPLFRIIPLPLQTVMILGTTINTIFGAIYLLGTGQGIEAVALLPSEVLGGIILHPITALLAGFLMAGSMQAAKGFDALKVIINKLQTSPIGLAGTAVIIVQIPTMVAMPCGRILAAALLPVVITLGPEELKIFNKRQMIVMIGAFVVNSAASCGPSVLGGIGTIGEGFLGEIGFLRASQSFGILLGTAMMALFLKIFSAKLYPHQVGLSEMEEVPEEEKGLGRKIEMPNVPWQGYFSLIVFAVATGGSIFQLFGVAPVQTALTIGALINIIVARVRFEDLMAGIIIHPVTALTAGFLMAGSLAATGGFDALGNIFDFITTTPLGLAGMLAIFVQIETMLPMPCGRILAAALLPVMYALGPAEMEILTYEQVAIGMAAFIVNAAASCGPSPIGGVGTIGEGLLRSDLGFLRTGQSFAIMAGMTPLAAIVMKFLTIEGDFVVGLILIFILLIVNLILMNALDPDRISGGEGGKKDMTLLAFIIGGAVAGAIIAFSLDMSSGTELMQGAIGGIIAGIVMALI